MLNLWFPFLVNRIKILSITNDFKQMDVKQMVRAGFPTPRENRGYPDFKQMVQFKQMLFKQIVRALNKWYEPYFLLESLIG